MRTLRFTSVAIGLITAGLLLGGCSDDEYLGEETVGANASSVESSTSSAHTQPPAQSGAQGATVYRASLTALEGFSVTGEAMVRAKGDQLFVSINSKGLAPRVEHAQHVHAREDCSDFGPPIVSLDDDIANEPGDATNADPGDDSFPTATPGETVNYRQKDSKEAVEEALGEGLDLANRTVAVHAAGTPIGPPAACGELNPVGN